MIDAILGATPSATGNAGSSIVAIVSLNEFPALSVRPAAKAASSAASMIVMMPASPVATV